mgnify:CR=1 FL=1
MQSFMGLLNIFKKKPKQNPSRLFSILYEQLEQMVQWVEVPALRKEKKTLEFTAIDEEGNAHHFVYPSQSPTAIPVFGFLAEQAYKLCAERKYLFHQMVAYEINGTASGSMGPKRILRPGSVWLYECLEAHRAAEEKYKREKEHRDRIYALAQQKGNIDLKDTE